jgi:hypothetical protein
MKKKCIQRFGVCPPTNRQLHLPGTAGLPPADFNKAVRYAREINAVWRPASKSMVQAIVEVGQKLEEASKALKRRGNRDRYWCSLFKGERNAVPEPVPFSLDKAEKLMRIARHPVLTDPANVEHLPAAWTTLAWLATLPDEQVKAGLQAGTIHSGMTGDEALGLAGKRPKRPSRKKDEPVPPRPEEQDPINAVSSIVEIRQVWAAMHDIIETGYARLCADEDRRHCDLALDRARASLRWRTRNAEPVEPVVEPDEPVQPELLGVGL